MMSVCRHRRHLSVVYRPRWKIERQRKTKIGIHISHITCNSHSDFKVKRSRSPRLGGHIVHPHLRPDSLFYRLDALPGRKFLPHNRQCQCTEGKCNKVQIAILLQELLLEATINIIRSVVTHYMVFICLLQGDENEMLVWQESNLRHMRLIYDGMCFVMWHLNIDLDCV